PSDLDGEAPLWYMSSLFYLQSATWQPAGVAHARHNTRGTTFLSGIAAVLNLDGSAVSQSEVEGMANVLKPFGPDRQKILIREKVAFVFCPHQPTPEDSFEHQPLVFADRFVVLFDGRIDNRSELSDALGISATELHAMPDSMIVLRLFDCWGERAFDQIVGV